MGYVPGSGLCQSCSSLASWQSAISVSHSKDPEYRCIWWWHAGHLCRILCVVYYLIMELSESQAHSVDPNDMANRAPNRLCHPSPQNRKQTHSSCCFTAGTWTRLGSGGRAGSQGSKTECTKLKSILPALFIYLFIILIFLISGYYKGLKMDE